MYCTCLSLAPLILVQQSCVQNSRVVLYSQDDELRYKSGQTNKPSPATVRYFTITNFDIHFFHIRGFLAFLSHGESWNLPWFELLNLPETSHTSSRDPKILQVKFFFRVLRHKKKNLDRWRNAHLDEAVIGPKYGMINLANKQHSRLLFMIK